jgi:Ca-activated chloride channel family protein
MTRPALLVLLCACHGAAATPAPAPPPPAPPKGPPVAAASLVPGAELEAPPPPPRRGPHRAGKGLSLALGADRAALALRLPAPPRGAAAPFLFGDDREGWVARIPESLRLPSVAYGDGRVFVSGGFESTSMYALDAHDGHMLWASQALEDNGPTAPSYQDGRLIFNTESCTLFVLDGATGKKLWFKYLGDPTLSQPSVADGLVFASHPSAAGQKLSAYRLRDGHEVWSRAIDAELLAAPILHGDSLYAATLTGRLYRMRRADGRRLWSQAVHATSAPWVQGGELYLGRADGGREVTVAMAADDGRTLRQGAAHVAPWLADVPRDMNDWPKVWGFEGSRPVLAGGVLYQAIGNELAALDPTTLAPSWSRTGTGAKRGLGAVAVAGPQVVVATRAGEVYGIDIDTGYTLWAYALGTPVFAQPIIARGWVYVTTADGQVVALHVGDATLDGWHMWGGSPGKAES